MIHARTEEGYPINIPTTFHGYKLLKIIGFGSTSIVGLVKDLKTSQLYASKVISKTDVEKKNTLYSIQKEIGVMGEVNHPNIVKIIKSFDLKNKNNESYIIVIMEYCENGDLLTYGIEHGFENEYQKQKVIVGFLSAIRYLHNRGISHGDIKADNIMLDSDLNPKLTDFGFCRTTLIAGDEAKKGTIFYAAPELFVPGEFDTLKADIWSIGITLYSLIENHFPYKSGDPNKIVDEIKAGKLSMGDDAPQKLKNLVQKCTQKNPENRPSIDEIMMDDFFLTEEQTSDMSKRNNPTMSFSSSSYCDECGI